MLYDICELSPGRRPQGQCSGRKRARRNLTKMRTIFGGGTFSPNFVTCAPCFRSRSIGGDVRAPRRNERETSNDPSSAKIPQRVAMREVLRRTPKSRPPVERHECSSFPGLSRFGPRSTRRAVTYITRFTFDCALVENETRASFRRRRAQFWVHFLAGNFRHAPTNFLTAFSAWTP